MFHDVNIRFAPKEVVIHQTDKLKFSVQKLTWIVHKYPVRTAQETLAASVIKTNKLVL